MLAFANMQSAAPRRRRNAQMVLLAYLPFLAWSLIGAGWTLWHHPFTRWFAGAYLLLIIWSLAYKRTIGGVTAMIGIAGCQLTTAFALHTWLRLPIWTVGVFIVASFGLLIAVASRRVGVK
jgi:hypothetical protein